MISLNKLRKIYIPPNKLCNLRYYCTKKTSNEYIPIYKFPYVRAFGIINQLKYYQSILTTIALPSTIVLNNFGLISGEALIITNTLGLTGTITFFLLGIIPNRLVGFVYIKNDDKTVKISYLDFWGRRKDSIIPLQDLVPLSDLPAIPTDSLYLTMRRFTSSDTYKINLKFGMILEEEKFKDVFLDDK